ncbi:MAG: hypothetical protein WC548_02135 [Candidatus Pacearchaeota archaeon]
MEINILEMKRYIPFYSRVLFSGLDLRDAAVEDIPEKTEIFNTALKEYEENVPENLRALIQEEIDDLKNMRK